VSSFVETQKMFPRDDPYIFMLWFVLSFFSLAENTGRKKIAKNRIAIWAPSHNFVGLYLRN